MQQETRNRIMSCIAGYGAWVQAQIGIQMHQSGAVVTLPFLDRKNDYLVVYIGTADNGALILHDDSETLAELHVAGVDVLAQHTRIETIANGHSVTLDAVGALVVHATPETFSDGLHRLVQVMIVINNLVIVGGE